MTESAATLSSYLTAYTTLAATKPASPSVGGNVAQLLDDGTVKIVFESNSPTYVEALRDWLLLLAPES